MSDANHPREVMTRGYIVPTAWRERYAPPPAPDDEAWLRSALADIDDGGGSTDDAR